MTHGNGVSCGDRNRNARATRLRAAVPVSNAIVGIDLAERKQMVVVTDHDSRVLARNDAEDALRLNGGRVGHFPRGFFPDGVRRAEVESLARFHEQADQPSPWVMTCYA